MKKTTTTNVRPVIDPARFGLVREAQNWTVWERGPCGHWQAVAGADTLKEARAKAKDHHVILPQGIPPQAG